MSRAWSIRFEGTEPPELIRLTRKVKVLRISPPALLLQSFCQVEMQLFRSAPEKASQAEPEVTPEQIAEARVCTMLVALVPVHQVSMT